MSYTYVLLPLSKAAYDEIKTKLTETGYQHAIHENGRIDMHGLAIVIDEVHIRGEEVNK